MNRIMIAVRQANGEMVAAPRFKTYAELYPEDDDDGRYGNVSAF